MDQNSVPDTNIMTSVNFTWFILVQLREEDVKHTGEYRLGGGGENKIK